MAGSALLLQLQLQGIAPAIPWNWLSPTMRANTSPSASMRSLHSLRLSRRMIHQVISCSTSIHGKVLTARFPTKASFGRKLFQSSPDGSPSQFRVPCQ